MPYRLIETRHLSRHDKLHQFHSLYRRSTVLPQNTAWSFYGAFIAKWQTIKIPATLLIREGGLSAALSWAQTYRANILRQLSKLRSSITNKQKVNMLQNSFAELWNAWSMVTMMIRAWQVLVGLSRTSCFWRLFDPAPATLRYPVDWHQNSQKGNRAISLPFHSS